MRHSQAQHVDLESFVGSVARQKPELPSNFHTWKEMCDDHLLISSWHERQWTQLRAAMAAQDPHHSQFDLDEDAVEEL